MKKKKVEKPLYFPIFAERLKNLREEQGLTQIELCKELEKFNINGNTISARDTSISEYETGGHVPDIIRLRGLCQALNVSADYLLGLSNAKNTELDIQAISKATGLSDNAISALQSSIKEKEEDEKNPIQIPGLPQNNTTDSNKQISYKHELINSCFEKGQFITLFKRILTYIRLNINASHFCFAYDKLKKASNKDFEKDIQQMNEISNNFHLDVDIEEFLLQEIVKTLILCHCIDIDYYRQNTKVILSISKPENDSN